MHLRVSRPPPAMPRTTNSFLAKPSRSVPVARRQLFANPTKLAVSVLAVAAAITLVLLLSGLRRGMGDQVTTYLRHEPPVVVGQTGMRNFLSQASVLTEATVARIARVQGVADASPITEGSSMLPLHGKRVPTVLVGFDPGRRGGPWALSSGRAPRALGEIAVDRVLADEHGLRVGARMPFRGKQLRIVGLTSGTSGFMTPLVFTTRATANALNEQPGTATLVLVTPASGVAPSMVAKAVNRAVPGVSARLSSAVAANDRTLLVGAFSGPLTAMIAIASIVAVTVIAMSVYAEVRERSREYATLKAIGMAKRGVLRLVAVDASAVAVLGLALGIGFAVAATRLVAILAPKYLIVLTLRDVITLAAAAVAFALLAALAPGRFLARLDPATALHS